MVNGRNRSVKRKRLRSNTASQTRKPLRKRPPLMPNVKLCWLRLTHQLPAVFAFDDKSSCPAYFEFTQEVECKILYLMNKSTQRDRLAFGNASRNSAVSCCAMQQNLMAEPHVALNAAPPLRHKRLHLINEHHPHHAASQSSESLFPTPFPCPSLSDTRPLSQNTH
jgi:hypothetical protein